MNLVNRSVEFLKGVIAEKFNGDNVDRWMDAFIHGSDIQEFAIETAADLMEAMNYVNKHNNNYNMWSPTESIDSVKRESEVMIQENLL